MRCWAWATAKAPAATATTTTIVPTRRLATAGFLRFPLSDIHVRMRAPLSHYSGWHGDRQTYLSVRLSDEGRGGGPSARTGTALANRQFACGFRGSTGAASWLYWI